MPAAEHGRQARHFGLFWPKLAAIAVAAAQVAAFASQPGSGVDLPARVSALPMQFELNTGQTADEVKFVSRGPGYALFLTSTQAVLSLRSTSLSNQAASGPGHRDHLNRKRSEDRRGKAVSEAHLRMSLLDANPAPQIEGLEALPGTVNYFIGNRPSQWHTGIATFGKVKYHEVYRGVDLVYYGNQRQLEYDFVVNPGADPSRIVLGFTGASQVEVDAGGGLVAHLPDGDARWHKPFAYQDTPAGRQQIAAKFVVQASGRIGFELGAYDPNSSLTIDPVLAYATYIGGAADEFVAGIARDTTNNVYVIGDTPSLNFPTVNAYRSTIPGPNSVVAFKLNPSLSALMYSTYLGGTSNDYSGGIAVDSSGNAYLTGQTHSQNFPTANAAYGANSGFSDIFVTKLGPSGSTLVFSTYLGGGADESGMAIAVDTTGNAYVAGWTYSIGTGPSPFPTTHGAFQGNNAGGPEGEDAFVAKFSSTGSLVYSTFLGGSTSDESANAIAVDSAGNACVVGEVDGSASYDKFGNRTPPSSNFPVVGAFQPTFNLGNTDDDFPSDAFVTKLNAAGSGLIFSTFLGGSDLDNAQAVAIDASGRIYVAGATFSSDFPSTANAVQPVNGGVALNGTDFPGEDLFVTVFPASGSSPVYSTYLGGSADDFGSGVAVDGSGYIYVAGQTSPSPDPDFEDFPLTVGADQTNSFDAITNPAPETIGFVAKINPSVPGSAGLIYCSFLGGNAAANAFAATANEADGIAVDAGGNFFYAAGLTTTTNFPVTSGAFRSTNAGAADMFVARFSSPRDISVTMVPDVEPVVVSSNVTYTIYVNNNSGPSSPSFTGVTNLLQIATNLQLLSVTTDLATNISNGRLAFIIGTFTNNASKTMTVTCRAVGQGPGTNICTLSSFETSVGLEPNTGNNVSAVVSTVLGIVDVRLTAIASSSSVFVSSNLTYTLNIQNKSSPYNNVATSIIVTDTLPAQVTFVSATNAQGSFCFYDGTNTVTCTLTGLAVGSNVPVSITVMGSTPGSGVNFASATSFDFDLNPANNSASLVTTVNALADMALGLSQSPNTVFVGGNISCAVAVTNLGPSPASSVVLSESVPPGARFIAGSPAPSGTNGSTVTWNLGSVAMGTNAAANISFNLVPMVAGIMTNTVSIAAFETDPFMANNSASVLTTVNPAADLSIFESAAPTSVLVTSNVTFAVSLVNNGPSAATGVTLVNSLPAGFILLSAVPSQGACTLANGVLTCNLGTMNNGTLATLTITARAALDGVFTSSVNATANESDLNTNNNTSSATVTVTPNPTAPLLRIKSVGTNVVLSWATNALNYYLQTCLSLVPNISWTIVTNVPVRAANQFVVTNPAAGPAQLYRLLYVAPKADMALGIRASPNPVYLGSNVGYTIVVTNLGPFPATGVMLTNTVPPGTTFSAGSPPPAAINGTTYSWSLGTLATGASSSVSFTLTPTVVGILTNIANVAANEVDTNLVNNSATVLTTVSPDADLSVLQTVLPGSVRVTSNVTFTATVLNNGPSPATGVTLTDSLPPAFSVLSVQPSQGTYALANGVLTCNLGSLNIGAQATLTITAKAILDGVFTNAAGVAANERDLNTGNNSASATVTITPNPTAPLLKITLAGTNAILSWATNALNYSLQSSPSLATNGLWTAITNIPKVVGNQYMVTNSLAGPPKFYRLIHSGPFISLSFVRPNVVIAWSALAPPSGTLKTTTSLRPPVAWSTVTNIPVLTGTQQWVVTNSISGTSRFYRLFF